MDSKAKTRRVNDPVRQPSSEGTCLSKAVCETATSPRCGSLSRSPPARRSKKQRPAIGSPPTAPRTQKHGAQPRLCAVCSRPCSGSSMFGPRGTVFHKSCSASAFCPHRGAFLVNCKECNATASRIDAMLLSNTCEHTGEPRSQCSCGNCCRQQRTTDAMRKESPVVRRRLGSRSASAKQQVTFWRQVQGDNNSKPRRAPKDDGRVDDSLVA